MTTTIDNIMALAEQYASAAWHHLSFEESKKRHEALRAAIEQALNTCGSGAGCLYKEARIEALEQALGQQEPVSPENIEQYRLQMAAISTAAIGYWKEGDSIHPDYDTLALRDVAKLYAKYDELYKQVHAPRPRRNVTYVCPCCHFSLERQE